MGEEFENPAKECSDLPSSVHNPEQKPESGDDNHRGMKYCIHYTIPGQVPPLWEYWNYKKKIQKK